MSREDWEAYEAERKERQKQGGNRRGKAARQFEEASMLAAQYSFMLIRHSDVHYKVSGKNKDGEHFTIEVYPGNRRLYHPTKKSPFIRLPDAWTLIDVVRAVAKALGKENGPQS